MLGDAEAFGFGRRDCPSPGREHDSAKDGTGRDDICRRMAEDQRDAAPFKRDRGVDRAKVGWRIQKLFHRAILRDPSI